MGGQNERISKHFAVGRMGWCNPVAGLRRLRVKSIWVARMHGFPNILRREWWEGVFQTEPYDSLGSSQYGWPECKGFQAFCGGKGGREDCRRSLMAA